jgi:IclR family KDG regulon transcriptional repressor
LSSAALVTFAAAPSGLARAWQVLALYQGTTSWRLAEIARATGLAKTTTHRLVTALAELGLLRRMDNGEFVLGSAFFQITEQGSLEAHVRRVARPYLERLQQLTQLQVALTTHSAEEAVVLDVRGHGYALSPGTAFPLATSRAATALLGHGSRTLSTRDHCQRLQTPNDVGHVPRSVPAVPQPRVVLHLNELGSADAAVLAVDVPAADSVPAVALSVISPPDRLNTTRMEHLLREVAAGLSRDLIRSVQPQLSMDAGERPTARGWAGVHGSRSR